MKRNVLPVKDDILIERMKRSMTALRQFRGWSMQQLGARAGVTKQTISNIENGRSELPKPYYVLIRMAFQTSLYELDELDRVWFSYMLDTVLDPNIGIDLVDNLIDAMITDATLVNHNRASKFNIIVRMIPGIYHDVVSHRIRYTSDPDGLDWYYDLMGVTKEESK